MIFHRDGDLLFGGELGQFAQTVGGQFLLFFITAFALRVDANEFTAQELGGLDPFVMIFDGLRALGLVGIAERAFAIHHDQAVFNAKILGAFVHLLQVSRVFGFILEKLIDVFDRADAVLLFGDFGKIQVIEFFLEQRAMQRPLRQRDFENLFGRGQQRFARNSRNACDGSRLRGLFDEFATINSRNHSVSSLSV